MTNKYFKLNLYILFSITIFLGSCKQSPTYMQASSGKTAEVLFVTAKKHWEGHIGDHVKSAFTAEYLGLNQSEPLFSLAQIEEKAFSKLFESHRNIFLIEIDAHAEKPIFEVRRNVWAQPQLVLKIIAPNEASFIDVFSKQKDYIIGLLYENERTRFINAFKRDEDITISNALKKNYKLTLTIPKGYFLALQETDFFWIRRESEETSMGILFYTFDYTDTLQFNMAHIIQKRDSITKMYVPGARDNSYMQVSQKVVLPISKQIAFKDMYAIETRGLWDVHGDFMGGPFLNITFLNEKSNKIFVLDGFVYAPRYNKRDYILQLEALLHSFSFVN